MKKRTFKHLNQAKRDRIEALQAAEHIQKDIAEILEVDPSTISRELSRRARKDGRYQATNAEHKAKVKRSNSKHQGMKIEKYPEMKAEIIRELEAFRSPDEIAGRMKVEGRVPRIGKDAIYLWIRSPFGQKYAKYLCTKRYKKKKQREDKTKRHIIPNMARIRELNQEALDGNKHFQGDTFVSPKKLHTTASAAIVVATHSKFITGRKLSSLKPSEMKDAIVSMKAGVTMETIVLDRGIENKYHEGFGVNSYFCDPHSPWQKPLVEGSIGLLRRWFWKKGTNLDEVTDEEFQKNIEIINNKYRKSLNYLSANEVAKKDDILKF